MSLPAVHLPIYWKASEQRMPGIRRVPNVCKCINSPTTPRRLLISDEPEKVTCRRCREIANLE